MRWRIMSGSPGFCCTACCNAAPAWEGVGRGGFCARTLDAPHDIPPTSKGRRERGEVLPGAPCGDPVRGNVICAASPQGLGNGTWGEKMGANYCNVKMLKHRETRDGRSTLR